RCSCHPQLMANSTPNRNPKYLRKSWLCRAVSPENHPLDSAKTLYYYGLVPLVLGIAAVFGGIAGLVIPAVLTTVDGQSQATPVVPRQNAPTAHRGVFGQRVVGR